MRLPKIVFAGILLTIVVAALLAQEDPPSNPATPPDEESRSIPVEIAVDDGKTNMGIPLKGQRAATLKSFLQRILEAPLLRGDLIIESDEGANMLLIAGARDVVDRVREMAITIDQFKLAPTLDSDGEDAPRRLLRGVTPKGVSALGLMEALHELAPQMEIKLSPSGTGILFTGDEEQVNEIVDLADRIDELSPAPKRAAPTNRVPPSSDELAEGQALRLDSDQAAPRLPELNSYGQPKSAMELSMDAMIRKSNQSRQSPAASSATGGMVEMMRTMSAQADRPADELSRQFQMLNEECVQIARRYRDLAERNAPASQLQTERQSLLNAVTAAFDARHRWQEAEVRRLQERLKNLERTIASRNQARNQIIERRVAELLNPEQRWDNGPSDVSTSSTLTPRPEASRPRGKNAGLAIAPTIKDAQRKASRQGTGLFLSFMTEREDVSRLMIDEVRKPPVWQILEEAGTVWFEVDVQSTEGKQALLEYHVSGIPELIFLGPDQRERLRIKGFLPAPQIAERLRNVLQRIAQESGPPLPVELEAKSGGAAEDLAETRMNRAASSVISGSGADSEARALIEASAALGQAKAALSETELLVDSEQSNVHQLQEIAHNNRNSFESAIDAANLQTAGNSLHRAQTQKRRAENDLKTAIRQERQARLALETRIKLLEIDLSSAQLSLSQAVRDEARAKSLFERAVVTQSELDEKQTATRLADLSVRKAETLLGAARQALKAADGYAQPNPPLEPADSNTRLNPPAPMSPLNPVEPGPRLDSGTGAPTEGSTTTPAENVPDSSPPPRR